MFFLVMGLSAASAQAATTVNYCVAGPLRHLTPFKTVDSATVQVASLLYNRLLEPGKNGRDLGPSLAKSYSVSKDGLRITVKLRKDIKFHTTKYFKPSRTLNADDVLFTFDRQRFPRHYYYNVGGATNVAYRSRDLHRITHTIKKIDTYTIRFHLKQPHASYLEAINGLWFGIQSKEYANSILTGNRKKNIDRKPIGTGPFMFSEYKKGEYLKLKSNPDYFRGAPAVDINVLIVAKAEDRFNYLREGRCQIVGQESPAMVERIDDSLGLKIFQRMGNNVGYLAMNTRKAPLDNKLVRQAINMAVDRDRILRKAYNAEYAMIAKGPIDPGSWAYNQSIRSYRYNPEAARKLLKKAGHPKGFSIQLWVPPISRPYLTKPQVVAEMIAADLLEVGIKVTFVTDQWARFVARAKRGEHALILLGWMASSPDPDDMLSPTLSCDAIKNSYNFARWCHLEFDKLLRKGLSSHNRNERAIYYDRAQKILEEEVPWVPLAHGKYANGARKEIHDLILTSFGLANLEKVKVK